MDIDVFKNYAEGTVPLVAPMLDDAVNYELRFNGFRLNGMSLKLMNCDSGNVHCNYYEKSAIRST